MLRARTAVLMIVAASGCSGSCQNPLTPLPAPLPQSQIVEGGVQVRITPTGLVTVTHALESILNQTLLGNGVCIPGVVKYDPGTLFPYIDACYQKNACDGGQMGCRLDLTLDSASLAAADGDTLRADVVFDASSSVPVHAYYSLFDVGSCTFDASIKGGHLIVDVDIGVDGASGNITLGLGAIDTVNLDNLDLSSPDCGVLADILSAVVDVANFLFNAPLIGNLVKGLVAGPLNTFIQGFLPRPLGLEGVLDVGALLSSLVPGVSGKIEVHGVPGGYAGLPAGGISLGVNVGLNADRDPTTRGPTDSSQPALCVPQWSAPDLSAPPASLPRTARGTFALAPVAEFQGSPDPAADVAVGVSQTVLDLAGHHIVSSGALCLSLGSSLTPQLNLGTVGILVPSLAQLGKGMEPIQLVLRPTAPITFDIGDGTTTSPFLTAHLQNLEIDFYPLLFERYTRAFTVGASLDVGINLTFMLDKNNQAVIVPALVGLDASKIHVTVSNTDLLRESPTQLQTVFPTLINLVLPLLSSALPDFPVPSFSGFMIGDLKLAHVTSAQDDFLAVTGSLAMAAGKPRPAARATTEARVVRTSAPPLADLRAGVLPEVELELGGTAPDGAPLEWQWNLDGGMWRPFADSPRLVISDPALALEGRHGIQVRARAVGRYDTTDVDGVEVDVVIDSIPPRILGDAPRRDGDAIVVEAHDLVSADAELGYALGRVDADTPATPWAASAGRLALTDVANLADAAGRVKLFVRDQAGNVATAILDTRHIVALEPIAPAAGCAVGGGGPGGALLVVVALLVARRRRALLALLLASCSANKVAEAPSGCTTDVECATKCSAGQLATCGTGGMCACADELPIGLIGTYASMAVTSTGTVYVSAYNATYGDLMVAQTTATGRIPATAWEFVDGVPSGPVAVKGSKVRGGVSEPGDDVGWYTSIAVTPAGEPVVSYYDATHASLRFAQKSGGTWHSYTVDSGVPMAKDLGKYTAITVDGSGRPGIGYLALIKDGAAAHSEVRFAQAARALPAGPGDWSQVLVESKAIPMEAADQAMLDDLPDACGLFVAATRTLGGVPMLAYYDRPAKALKLAPGDGNGFSAPIVIEAGAAGVDAGWYPSLAVSPDGTVHIAYIDRALIQSKLMTVDWPDGTPVVVDDGYRTDGTTAGGLPDPVYHQVGDNSAIVNNGHVSAIVYQDATSQDLLLATPGSQGWTRTTIAGGEMPYKGAYGFYAAAGMTSNEKLWTASYVIDQAAKDQWVEVFATQLQPAPAVTVPGG
jgi:MYXO-CTERM domain-containing protein